MSNHPDRPAAVTTSPTPSLTREPPPTSEIRRIAPSRTLKSPPLGPDARLIRDLTESQVIGRGNFAASIAYPLPSYKRIPVNGRWDLINYIRVLNDPGDLQ